MKELSRPAHNPETIKQAGMRYFAYVGNGQHILMGEGLKGQTQYEVYGASKGYAGWCIIYKNTHLEFCRSIPSEVAIKMKFDYEKEVACSLKKKSKKQ